MNAPQLPAELVVAGKRRPKCDAILGFTHGDIKRPVTCHQFVGLRSLPDQSGTTRYYCAADGHLHRVLRMYGQKVPA